MQKQVLGQEFEEFLFGEFIKKKSLYFQITKLMLFEKININLYKTHFINNPRNI